MTGRKRINRSMERSMKGNENLPKDVFNDPHLYELLSVLLEQKGLAFWDAVFSLVENEFGICPSCGRAPFITNNYKDDYAGCDKCKCFWWVGWDLMGDWRYETEDDWAANRKILKQYRKVENALHDVNEIKALLKRELQRRYGNVDSTEGDIPF